MINLQFGIASSAILASFGRSPTGQRLVIDGSQRNGVPQPRPLSTSRALSRIPPQGLRVSSLAIKTPPRCPTNRRVRFVGGCARSPQRQPHKPRRLARPSCRTPSTRGCPLIASASWRALVIRSRSWCFCSSLLSKRSPGLRLFGRSKYNSLIFASAVAPPCPRASRDKSGETYIHY
jgi:hypothetical protein